MIGPSDVMPLFTIINITAHTAVIKDRFTKTNYVSQVSQDLGVSVGAADGRNQEKCVFLSLGLLKKHSYTENRGNSGKPAAS